MASPSSSPVPSPLPDGSGPPALHVVGLSAGFGTRLVLRDVDLAVAQGGVTAVLGPNGAGKTTLVRAVCGRLRPKTGAAHICGRAAQTAAARHLIGLAPQENALYGALTIAENLETFARLAGVPRSATRALVGEVMDRAGIRERADERVELLSGGWQRRANVAAALMGSPRLLVLDEPTVGIDAPAREALARLVGALAGDGLGILLVTHDFAFTEQVADRVAFLVAGRVVHEGRLDQMLTEHFAGRRLVEITFADAPPAPLVPQLAALGLGATGRGPIFAGLIADDAQAVADLLSALNGLGAMPRALALKPAGLEALYDAIVHDDTADEPEPDDRAAENGPP